MFRDDREAFLLPFVPSVVALDVLDSIGSDRRGAKSSSMLKLEPKLLPAVTELAVKSPIGKELREGVVPEGRRFFFCDVAGESAL